MYGNGGAEVECSLCSKIIIIQALKETVMGFPSFIPSFINNNWKKFLLLATTTKNVCSARDLNCCFSGWIVLFASKHSHTPIEHAHQCGFSGSKESYKEKGNIIWALESGPQPWLQFSEANVTLTCYKEGAPIKKIIIKINQYFYNIKFKNDNNCLINSLLLQ